jgi:hypothetical protein
MPREWSEFKEIYAIEHFMLPEDGQAVAVIEDVGDEEGIDPKTGEKYVKRLLFLAGWNVPLRLNATLVGTIEALFGPIVEDSIGQRIIIKRELRDVYGENKVKVGIDLAVLRPDTPATPVPARYFTESKKRVFFAEEHGVQRARALPAGSGVRGVGMAQRQNAAGFKPGPWAAPAMPDQLPALVGKPLGNESAARLMIHLAERGKDWGWIVNHLMRAGMREAVEGRIPPECDQCIKRMVWGVIQDLPLSKKFSEQEATQEMQRLMALWVPPAAIPARTVTERVDTDTGEVIRPGDATTPAQASVPASPAAPAQPVSRDINFRASKPAPPPVSEDDIPF